MKTILLLPFAAALVLAFRPTSLQASATAPTLVHSFNGYSEGAYPRTPLVLASDGTFYGAAGSGGSAAGALGKGTSFKITAGGAVTALAAFPAVGTGGGGPNSLVLAADGNLYGTTSTTSIWASSTGSTRRTAGAAATSMISPARASSTRVRVPPFHTCTTSV